MTSYATRTQSSSDQNDLKKLKSKYSSKLSTLQELFADWSDDDLLFALDEADGVLEIAVERISEGHATQWGEVKTKKTKKEAQQKAKAAAATAAPSASQTMSYQRPERPFTDRPKSTKARAPSTNNHSKKPASTTTTSSWGYNSSSKPSSSSALDTAAGSWASIASTKPAHDSSSDWNTSPDISFGTTANDSRDQQSSWGNEEHTGTTTSSALLDDVEKPKSWASLLKSQPKPEPEPVQETEPIEQQQQQQYNEVVEDGWSKKVNDPVIEEFNVAVETPVDAWDSTTTKPEVASKLTSELSENNDARSPVTVPNDDATLASVDLKFGSLNLDNDVVQKPTQTEESQIDTKIEAQPQPPAALERNTTANDQQPVQQPSTLTKEEPVYTQSQAHQQPQQVPAPATTQVQQPQQLSQQNQLHHPQQTPLSVDHLTSAYNSYLPNQHLTGFGMSPMGNVPDYGTYGTEAQRAAAMGYYDPSTFNNSPVTTNASTHPSRDKFGQDTSAPIGQAQGLHGQQMYPGMPYYPYYYMPNHYNAYQQNMYGQPMMNKSMYPNMYQQQQPQQQSQQSASVSKPSTQSSYGNGATANASPYALHSQLYNQPGSSMGGYDDLQQQFGLHDYQKSPYANTGGQQLQGFLGNHLQGHQQQQQPSQQSQAQSQSVDPTKSAISSQPQQQHHQMNNYFGQQQQQQQQQQQMFNYQQYPQQQYWNQ